ncbi:uncharacterized protein [Coffea arabica]|uniref:Uncharacterized protein isoform X2 n=1 Tax=Coffea arabica TaxID=13443 RepID=A0ABM4VEI4_COFAR|nr:HEAT repeat-containing protein 6 isoform X2 [Coffea arabica]
MELAAATSLSASCSSSPITGSWRTAFLSLRDETQSLPSLRQSHIQTILQLLNRFIFSQADNLIHVASLLPPDEVGADIMLLMELARNISDDAAADFDDVTQSFIQLSNFIHGTISRVSFKLDAASWVLSLDCFRRVVKAFLGKAKMNAAFIENASVISAIKHCLQSSRLLFGVCQRTNLSSGNKELLEFLHVVIACFQMESLYSSCSSGNRKVSKNQCVWEVQNTAFSIIGEVYLKVGKSLHIDIWESTIKVLRHVMDFLASNGPLAEDSVMATFYNSALHCLHMVLVDSKGSLSAHVAGFVAALRLFLSYGVANRNRFVSPEAGQGKELISSSKNLEMAELSKSGSVPYRPPHLRKRELKNLQRKDEESLSSAGLESSTGYHVSSDSDYSDGDGSARDLSIVRCDKTRLAAIICLQDLCRADPKSFATQWTMLLPQSDVLQPRKHEATLISCLLFDPYIKVAEFKDTTKRGSFTALSSSLGQILMQLHSGTLYLVKHEKHGGLLASLFKILTPLISSTPYSRMPPGLLLTVISSVRERIEDGFLVRIDQTSLLAAAFDCLTVALSVSPPSVQVKHMLLEEVGRGFLEVQKKPGLLYALFSYSEPFRSPSISFESLQALRAVAHNYPSAMFSCWKEVSSIVYAFLRYTPDVQARLQKINAGCTGGPSWEKVITAAVKVFDECLRAISGFKGTEDLSDDRLLDDPFTSDYMKIKTISSAPFYGSESPASPTYEVNLFPRGCEQWSEAIAKHMPLILRHSSAVVRAASVTCFAGLTSPVFMSLHQAEQDFILSSSVDAALSDEVPSVRSAACRAIGVIACFPQVIQSEEILDKLVYAVVHNTNDSLVSVRITASWALANICDSLRHCVDLPSFTSGSGDSKGSSELISILINSALHLSKDNDKIKANAVRALGNLAGFVPFSGDLVNCNEGLGPKSKPLINSSVKHLSKRENLYQNSKSFQPGTSTSSDWLEKMVQAFVSCVTTGNVKVQWNVCHALSNLFVNKTLELHDKDWAPAVFSILLLLVRDSANFKIRIQAVTALAVPSTVDDYGRSFYDVLQGVVNVSENLNSDKISSPSNFKYKVALENQLTSTMLHVIGLASGTDCGPIEEFLVKKTLFLEEWLRALCSSLDEGSIVLQSERDAHVKGKKDVILRALRSLVKVFEVGKHHALAGRFHQLLIRMQ